jgi:hypothetical protein
MKKLLSAILIVFLLSLTRSASCQENTPTPCRSLLTDRCEKCHYSTRVCQALEKKSLRKWKRTIERMIRYGAVLSPAEEALLTDCLFSAKTGDKDICR